MIATINDRLVSSWIIVDDVMKKLGDEQLTLATTLLHQHEYPFDFMFFSPEGKFVTRLTSFKDLRSAHPTVGHPRRGSEESHTQVFLETITKHFGEKGSG